MEGTEIGLGIFLLFAVLSYAIPALITIKMIIAIVKSIKHLAGEKENKRIKLDGKRSIDLRFSDMDNTFHEGCQSEGNMLHPEKSGKLKAKDNPFEY